MNKIWVVEKGDYSDYRVVGVFTSEEKAKQICDLINRDGHFDAATVAEWPLDQAVNEINQGLDYWAVEMNREGKVTYTNKIGWAGWEWGTSINSRGRLHSSVWAKDEQHAVKIVNEKRAQMIAMNEWPNG